MNTEKTWPVILGIVTVAAFGGCATPPSPNESAAQGSELAHSVNPAKPSARITDLTRAASAHALREARAARTTATVGGLVSIFDDPLTNSHGFTQAIFFDQHIPIGCIETIPIEGGSCEYGRVCDPPEPDFAGNLVDVGGVTISSTFDTFALSRSIFHEPETRSGPFWRGDGDMVLFSFAGNEGSAPAFSTTLPAPVADAAMRVPASVDRSAGLTVDWRYAVGTGPAIANMAITVSQTEPAGDQIFCSVPMTQRTMTVPASVLERFAPGKASITPTSTVTQAYGDVISNSSGAVKLLVQLTSTVDFGSPDPDAPNVEFR